jgi:hypothetical protein
MPPGASFDHLVGAREDGCSAGLGEPLESSQLLKHADIGDDDLALAEFQQTFALPDMELFVDALTRRTKHAGKLALGDADAPRRGGSAPLRAGYRGTLTVHHLGKTVSLGRYATHEFAAKAAAGYFAKHGGRRNPDGRLRRYSGAVAAV